MVTELLQKYIWMVQTFIRVGERGLSLTEIEDRWETRWDSPYSRRTFNNHRDAIEEVFGIRIECNRSTNRYFVRGSEDVSDENAESAWLINTFTVNNMLSLGKERLSGRIAVEDIPSGHRHLTSAMEAMTENKEVLIEYQKYTSEEAATYTLRPYAVKEFAKRWYIIGYCLSKNGQPLRDSQTSGEPEPKTAGLRVYGLDRVKNLELTERTFRMPANFDVDELFATSFGIYIPESQGQTIIFRTSPTEAHYLRDLPLHPTQQELPPETTRNTLQTGSTHPDGTPDTGSVTFSIFVCPNKGLIMELCKYGPRLEVLSPASVRNAVKEELAKALELYK